MKGGRTSHIISDFLAFHECQSHVTRLWDERLDPMTHELVGEKNRTVKKFQIQFNLCITFEYAALDLLLSNNDSDEISRHRTPSTESLFDPDWWMGSLGWSLQDRYGCSRPILAANNSTRHEHANCADWRWVSSGRTRSSLRYAHVDEQRHRYDVAHDNDTSLIRMFRWGS